MFQIIFVSGFIAGLIGLYLWLSKERDYTVGIDPSVPRSNGSKSIWGYTTDLNLTNQNLTYRDYKNKWGKYVATHLFGFADLLVADPDGVKEVMTSPYTQDKPWMGYEQIKAFLGDSSLVIIGGDHWKTQRKLVQQAFHRDNMKSYIGFMTLATQTLIDILDRQPNKFSIDMDSAFMRLTVDVILQAMFSERFDVQNTNHPLADALKCCTHELQVRLFNPIIYLNPFSQFRFRKAKGYLHVFFQDMIQQHRQRINNGTLDESKKDLIDHLLLARDEDGSALSDQEIEDQCITFFFAGHDTTAHTLAWTLYLVSQSPDVEKKLLEELDAVLGDRDSLEFSDLGHLPYMTMVLKETLRMYPPVGAVSRRVKDDTTIAGRTAKKGITVTCLIYSVHYDDAIWDQPNTFRPERFSEDESKERHPYAWFPFTLNQRTCIGKDFAMHEMKVVLAGLYKKYRFEMDRGRTVGVKSAISLQPIDGMYLYAIPRK